MHVLALVFFAFFLCKQKCFIKKNSDLCTFIICLFYCVIVLHIVLVYFALDLSSFKMMVFVFALLTHCLFNPMIDVYHVQFFFIG